MNLSSDSKELFGAPYIFGGVYMDELNPFDYQIMWLAGASLAPHSDLSKFVEIVCAQNHPRKFYELLMDFYIAREAYIALPMLIQRLAQFDNDGRFEL